MVLTDATLSNISFSDTQIKIKRGTAAERTAANPVLEAGELGYVSDTNTLKVGDGLTIETPGDPSTLDASLVAVDTMYFLDGT